MNNKSNKNVKGEIMVYEQFLKVVKEKVENRLGLTDEVSINKVLKNNSIELDGLVILKPGENMSPNIYLNEYYEQFMGGDNLENIIDKILDSYYCISSKKQETSTFSFEFDKVKDNIYYRLVSNSKNKKLLKETPNIRFLDLAITFHCLVNNDDSGIGSIRITREHMDKWEKNIKEIHKIARKNTPKLFPVRLCSMNDVIAEIYKEESYNWPLLNIEPTEVNNPIRTQDEENKEFSNQFIEELDQSSNTPMFILSNTRGINGASTMLYKDVIKDFANKLNLDLYILPSSIHEIILVPFQRSLSINSLSEMVVEVNRTQLSPDEILSDKVYFYNRSTNQIY